MVVDITTDSKIQNKRNIRKLAFAFIGVMVLATFFSNTVNNLSLPLVTTERAANGTLIKEVNGKGSVEPGRLCYIYAEQNRYIENVLVKKGEHVQKGQPLIILQKDNLMEQLHDEELRYEKMKVQIEKLKFQRSSGQKDVDRKALEEEERKLETAKAQYNIKSELFKAGAEAKEDVDKAKRELEGAEYNLAVKKQQQLKDNKSTELDIKSDEYDLKLQASAIEKIKKSLQKSVVTALCSGTIKEIKAEPGLITSGSDYLMSIADKEKGYRVKAQIDNKKASYLKVGDVIDVEFEALNYKRLKATIDEISDAENSKEGDKEILASFKDADLSGGEKCTVYYERKSKPYNVLVPNSSVIEDFSAGGYYVYILREKRGTLGNEFYVSRTVVTAADSDQSKTAILNGLESGEKVITSSDKELTDGCRVRIEK